MLSHNIITHVMLSHDIITHGMLTREKSFSGSRLLHLLELMVQIIGTNAGDTPQLT